MKSPDLQAILAGLDRMVSEANPNQLPAISAALSAVAAAAGARLVLVNGQAEDHNFCAPDVNLSAPDAAHRLGVSVDWLYKHHRKLPFARKIGRRVLFSARGLENWNRRKKS